MFRKIWETTVDVVCAVCFTLIAVIMGPPDDLE